VGVVDLARNFIVRLFGFLLLFVGHWLGDVSSSIVRGRALADSVAGRGSKNPNPKKPAVFRRPGICYPFDE
jgi:hypothetical protein